MVVVIFEVFPAPGKKQEYLDIAARLRPELEAIDGFISVERFASLSDQNKLLSLSFWRDEEAVRRLSFAGCGRNPRLRHARTQRSPARQPLGARDLNGRKLAVPRAGHGPCMLSARLQGFGVALDGRFPIASLNNQ